MVLRFGPGLALKIPRLPPRARVSMLSRHGSVNQPEQLRPVFLDQLVLVLTHREKRQQSPLRQVVAVMAVSTQNLDQLLQRWLVFVRHQVDGRSLPSKVTVVGMSGDCLVQQPRFGRPFRRSTTQPSSARISIKVYTCPPLLKRSPSNKRMR